MIILSNCFRSIFVAEFNLPMVIGCIRDMHAIDLSINFGTVSGDANSNKVKNASNACNFEGQN